MKPATVSSKLLNRLAFFLLLAVLALAGSDPCRGQPQPQAQTQPQGQPEAPTEPSFEDIKKSLDEVEAALDDGNVSAEKLVELREKINALASTLRDNLEEIEPRAREIAERLKQLGPVPPKDGPPESQEIATQRKQLTDDSTDIEGEVKQARLLLLRADQLSERVSEKRHTLYARELFARTQSILDPFFWLDVVNAVPVEWRRFDGLIASWQEAIEERVSGISLMAAALSLIAILLTTYFAGRWLSPFVDSSGDAGGSARAWTALRVFVATIARPSLAALAALLMLNAFGLLTARVEQIAQAMVVGIVVAAIGRGVARSLFAPHQPERRLTLVADPLAAILYRFLVWAALALALTISLQAVHKAAFAPLVITVATNALFAAATAALLAVLIFRLGRLKRLHAVDLAAVQWVHPLALIMGSLIATALLAGFASFAAFLALRVIVAAVAFGALHLLLQVVKASFAAPEQQPARGQVLAANLGITVGGLGLIGTVLSGTIRLLLVALSVLVIIGPWEISTADLFDTIRNVPFGFKIEEIHVSFRAILEALVALGVLILITRVVRRWLEHELLPRTAMEPSLQQSIATIFGYVGVIAAIALGLGSLGIDLQKIALVAGALSVGIGFGLQSIVSNFVSGLILLAERPIRTGDSIVVKGEEGWVRRVRVRATEIETFDRASVIIPNSELITGMVKNWTRANTLGRIVIKVGAPYTADPEKVREVLTGIANAHPQVAQSPEPAAYLLGFGNTALEFELRCIVLNVESALRVKSDLHFAIIKGFKDAAIEMTGELPCICLARRQA
jgi:potassium efflux system protein